MSHSVHGQLVHLMTNLTDKDAHPELIEDLSARVLQAGLMGLMARRSTNLGYATVLDVSNCVHLCSTVL